MRRLTLFLVVLAVALTARGVEPPVHTYSIVARDPATGQLGVAVQSHWFSVGWAAVTLATVGELEAALPTFRTVFAADPNWVELTRRLTAPGIIPDTPEGHALVERIVAAATAP